MSERQDRLHIEFFLYLLSYALRLSPGLPPKMNQRESAGDGTESNHGS